jgi:hypothetical protein
METPLKSSVFLGKSIEIASKISDSVTGQLEKLSKGLLLSTASTGSEMSSSQGGISLAILRGIEVKNSLSVQTTWKESE